MKIPPVKIKKLIPATLGGLEAMIIPSDSEKETILVNGQLKLTIGTRNRRIKKLVTALLGAHAELVIANKELAYQNEEKGKRAAELIIANGELIFQNGEKEKRASELVIANKEWAYQNTEKERRAAELIVANHELVFQNGEKEKRAAELIIANKELVFQNDEKEKRAAELLIANDELVFQNGEKEKRASELIIANKELAFQNNEKEKRAAELFIANDELAFQNEEKEKRAAELIIANKELAFQNDEKEKRAAELILVNKELESFAYIASHDLQEPLRKIQTFSGRILAEDQELSDTRKDYLRRMQLAGQRMSTLIEDLLTYSRINVTERKFEATDLTSIIDEIKSDLSEKIDEKQAVIEIGEMCKVNVITFQLRQLLFNLINNALKFSSTLRSPHIFITSKIENHQYHLSITDNGIGFEPEYRNRIFEVFQKLHGQQEYAGTGIGLAIVKKIIDNHGGTITATGELNKGARFDMYIPVG